MDIRFFLQGLIIGFSIAAPVGPIAVLCIRRTLAAGRAAGLVTGLGAATADAIYGTIAGFGLTFVKDFLVEQQTWLSMAGGVFLLYLGARTLFAKPPEAEAQTQNEAERRRHGRAGDYLSSLVLTLTNPVTILSFIAIFAGMGLANEQSDYLSAGALVLGVFLGSALWWLTLSGVASKMRGRVTPMAMVWVNRVSGVIIIVLGLAALLPLY